MKENKKVMPSLGVCGRNGAAAKSRKSPFLKLLALLCVLILSVGNAWGFSATVQIKLTTGGQVSTNGSNWSTSQQNAGGSWQATGGQDQITIYARSQRGYVFDNPAWSDFGNTKGNPSLSSHTEINRFTRSAVVTMDRGGSFFGGGNTTNITARFVANPVDSWLVEYVAAEHGSYTVTGPSGRGTNYGTVTVGSGSKYTTWNDDDIKLTATPATDYVFARFYAENSDGIRSTLGDVGVASQTVYIPEGTVKVGAEFTKPYYATYVQASAGGTYAVTGPANYGGVASGVVSMPSGAILTKASDQLSFTSTAETGWALCRYYATDEDGNIITLGVPAKKDQVLSIMDGPVTVSAEFTTNPFAIGEHTYATLDAALSAVKISSTKTILLLRNYEVPAGSYTIPEGVTLLIPKNANHIIPETTVERITDLTAPALFRKLTLARGVNLLVDGSIEVGGTQSAGAQAATGAGIPAGGYGQLEMKPGSKITLNNGANLYAWGFVTGDGSKDKDGNYLSGEIDARRGSNVYEQFQMYDWKGGSISVGMILNNSITNAALNRFGNDYNVFPVSQYFIQNVEVPTTYHPGSSLVAMTSINASNIIIKCDNVKVIGIDGETAMFLMNESDYSENTWVRKSYSVKEDRQIYDINSSARLGAMTINLPNVIELLGQHIAAKLESEKYHLPVTNNLKIHLLTGEMGITQNTVLLPGAEIEIDKTATVSIVNNKSLYLYDREEWKKYVFQSKYIQQVKYIPETGTVPGKRNPDVNPASAAINVHGTFDVKGTLYTTTSGANIFSSISDAGTVHFSKAATTSNGQVAQYKGGDSYNNVTYEPASCTSAKLKNDEESTYSNGDGYSETAGTPAGKSWCFIDIDNDLKGEWVRLTVDKDDECFVYNEDSIYYAKPSDYVALASGKTENRDHTYSSADGTRTFILVVGCQWWEVVYDTESGLYYCGKNDTYYYYDESDPNPNNHGWEVKTHTITWKNYDGTVLKDEYNHDIKYTVPYGSIPDYHNSTPTRPEDEGYYTYDFTDWDPKITASSRVTSDLIYTAVYERNPVMYTITWNNANGTEREVGYFQRDSMPVCRTEPAGMGTSWEWNPVVEPVTGNKTYTLQAIVTPKTSFTVTWKNYNGTTLQTLETDTDVPAGTTPTYNGADPSKASLDDVRFVWNKNDGWTPAISPVTADIVYMAKYTEQPITYAITWKNGEETLLEQNVSPNTVPQYTGATPTKPSDATYHYTFSGWSPTVVAATGDETYTAQFAETPVDKVVASNETVDEGKQQTVTNLTIETTGKLVIPTTSRVNATNLYLESTCDASGQIITNANTSINITGNVYFDLILNTPARHWHAFGVPWAIGNLDDVKLLADGTPLTLGRDYDIIWYDGAERAANGPGAHCWKYVEHNGKTLTPGQGYMIAFTRAVNTARFTKASGAPILYTGSMSVTPDLIGAISNPMAYHATLGNVGATVGQVHDGGEIGHDDYTEVTIANKRFVVGKTVYIDPSAVSGSVLINKADGGVSLVAAPARRGVAANKQYLTLEDYYTIALTPDNGGRAAKVYVLPEEDKEDQYVKGHDLAKFGMSDRKAQIWVNRYGTKLGLNTTAPVNEVAEFPISVYAPSAGEYTVSLNAQPNEDYIVYLTQDGEAIWNLSDAPYVVNLNAGVNKTYGLRLSAHKAPTVVTGVDEAVVDAQGETRKVLINDHVYIIRGNQVYTIDGQLVK